MFAKHNLSRHRDYLDHTSISGHPAFHCHIKAPCFAERVVEYFGLQKYFGSVYGSELDGSTRSDKGRLLAHVLKAESLSPHSTVMVGDRVYDILGARAQGESLGAPWGYRSFTDPMGICGCTVNGAISAEDK